MPVYSYARVSTRIQADDGDSLQTQQHRTQGYAMMMGKGIDYAFVERAVSGSVPLHERPEGKRMLDALQPGDIIIASKLDRMFRSALDALDVLETLKKQGVALHLIDIGGDVCSDGIAKLVFTILSAVAEAERDRIRERIKDVKTYQKTQKRFLGGSKPFGFKIVDGALVIDEAEQEALAAMRAMRAKGISTREIAKKMRDRSVTLSHMTVARLTA